MKKDVKTKGNGKVDIYKEMGFMCGFEIHQRLATEGKLFCQCITELVEKGEKPFGSLWRYQRAVAGELGSIDISAEFEEQKNRKFTYNIFKSNTCLVDVDEEPPHEMNRKALEIALSMAKALNMRVIDELQPMRKGVVDGSDPSAFQRTVMIGLGGSMSVDGVKIGVPSMFLEEESSGIAQQTSSSVTYNTDRLGIPLIEVDTDPTIPNPKVAKDVALYIGTLLRLTGQVQRGIGSIRQDVNLSIKGGARVEIKGVQELGAIDNYLENEIRRQKELITIKNELVKANAKVGEEKDATGIFKGTKVEVIKRNIRNGAVYAFPLTGFKGLLGREINPKRRLGTEISDYAKMAGVRGIIHSDEDLDKYGFGSDELSRLRKLLGIDERDSFILVAGNSTEAKKAVKLAIQRARYALEGVPKETRVAHDNENYTSRFLRPLPTGSRMYPETDVKPIPVSNEMLEKAESDAPNVEKEHEYLRSMVKNNTLVEQLMLSPRLSLFKSIVKESDADPEFVANVIIQKLTEMKREGIYVDSINDEAMTKVFGAYAKEKITKQAVEEALKMLAKEGNDADKVLEKSSLLRIKGNALIALVGKFRKDKSISTKELRSMIMSKYRLNIDGSELNGILSKG